MPPDLQPLGRLLILLGVILMACGAVVLLVPRVPWIGRLPGDLLIKRDHVTVYVPLASCLVASVLLSVLLWVVRRLRP
jgi:hypothetical protein